MVKKIVKNKKIKGYKSNGKKIVMRRLMLFLVIGSMAINCFAQSEFIYSTDGKKEYFKVRKDRVIIKTNSEMEARALSKQSIFVATRSFGQDMVIATIDTAITRGLVKQ